jgi:hypothetical protein
MRLGNYVTFEPYFPANQRTDKNQVTSQQQSFPPKLCADNFTGQIIQDHAHYGNRKIQLRQQDCKGVHDRHGGIWTCRNARRTYGCHSTGLSHL